MPKDFAAPLLQQSPLDNLKIYLQDKVVTALENGTYVAKIEDIENLLKTPVFADGFQSTTVPQNIRDAYVLHKLIGAVADDATVGREQEPGNKKRRPPHPQLPDEEMCDAPPAAFLRNKKKSVTKQAPCAAMDMDDVPARPPARLPLLEISQQLREITAILQPLLVNLESDAKDIKTWITLSKPKMEDGNNFGVEIQEHIESVADSVASAAADNLRILVETFTTRGELLAEATTHPGVEDTWRAVEFSDEVQFHRMRHLALDIRNDYILLVDQLTKNMDKIIKPRSANGARMYSN